LWIVGDVPINNSDDALDALGRRRWWVASVRRLTARERIETAMEQPAGQDHHRGKVLAQAVLTWASRALFGLIVAGTIGAIAVLFVIPRMTGGAALTVLTGSMTPDIPVGSVVVIRPVDPGTLRVGDVATYQVNPDQDAYITHRVLKIDDSTAPATFVFKGDANRGADTDPVPGDAIRGKVWFHVPYLGAVRDALHGRGGLSLLAVLLLGGYAFAQFLGGVRQSRQRRSESASTEGRSTRVRAETLVLARLDHRVLGERGLDARSAAREWEGIVTEDDGANFSLLLAPRPQLVELLLDVLAVHGAHDVVVLNGPFDLAELSDDETPRSERSPHSSPGAAPQVHDAHP
jgi:signal peptidase